MKIGQVGTMAAVLNHRTFPQEFLRDIVQTDVGVAQCGVSSGCYQLVG